MLKRYGIATTNHGTFFFAMVGQTSKGWKIKQLREWNNQSFFNNYLLLHKPVSLSLPAFWTKQLPTDTTGMVSIALGNNQSISTNQAEYELYSTILQHNIVGIYPHDAFMVTLPRSFTANPPPSFIAIFYDDPAIKIGIVHDNVLVDVHASIIASSSELTGFLGRIERCWNLHNPSVPFPVQKFSMNKLPFDIPDFFDTAQLKCGTENPDALKAVGCALCGPELPVPRFDALTNSIKPGILRTVILVVSCIMLLSTFSIIAGIFLYTKYYSGKLHTVKKQYQNILNNNMEIRQLIADGDLLAEKVLLQNDRLSHPTIWGSFLYFLGTARTEGLYFERFGTEQLKDNDKQKMRVAIAGWCTSETIATEFIKKLSSSSMLQNVALSSIERMPNQEALCKFKIICILSLSKN